VASALPEKTAKLMPAQEHRKAAAVCKGYVKKG